MVFAILIGLSAYMWMRSRRAPVDHRNVNDEWQDGRQRDAALDPATPAEGGPTTTTVAAPQV